MTEKNEKVNFTIIIPTCDRVETLQEVVTGLLELDYGNYSILVSDNYSSDSTESCIKNLQKNSRVPLDYVKTKSRLAMPEHWDFAFSHATGDYILICGDDDFIAPQALKVAANIIEQYDADLVSWLAGLYYFPNWKLKTPEPGVSMIGNVIHNPHRTTDNLYAVNKKEAVISAANFKWYGFPNFCNFVFKRELGQKIFEKTGKLFWPGSPDYTAPLLLMIEAENPYFKERCMAFGGRSLKSNYHSIMTRGEDKRFDEFFEEFGEQDLWPFHKPKLHSYFNFLISSISLAKHLYPEFMNEVNINNKRLCEVTYAEFYSKYGKVSAWNNPELIGKWEEYFKTLELSEDELESIKASQYELEKNKSSEALNLQQIGVLNLETLNIKTVRDVIDRFKEIEKHICPVSQRASNEWAFSNIYHKVNDKI